MKYIFLFSFLLASFPNFGQTDKYQELMEQDWANLNRYREANQEIIKSGDKPKVVFMGNSITEGWVQASPEFFSSNGYVGRGIGGQTTPQMLIRFTPDVIDLEPEAVVILAGTNDIAGNTGFSSVKMISDNIKAMAQLAMMNDIKVILVSVLPVYDYAWRPGLNPVPRIAELNSWMKDFASANGQVYLDLFTPMANEQKGMKGEYSEDGVHPNKKGYEAMEPLTEQAIQKILDQ